MQNKRKTLDVKYLKALMTCWMNTPVKDGVNR